MLKVGITGGIGSGKTTASQVFEILGVPVYYADTRAKNLMNTDALLRSSLIENFGKEIYATEAGELDRQKLADIIFHDKEALTKVNSLVHPAVMRDFSQWCKVQKTPYVLEEAAILFENGMAPKFGKIILVTAPDELRVKRVCARDGIAPEAVYARMKNQWPDEQKIALADFIIYNNTTHLLIPQVINIHQQLMNVAEEFEK